jgi:hypothetical protein
MPAHADTNFVREHLQALHIGSEVTRWFRKGREPQVLKVTPERVIEVLHGIGINAVLMGTHGINVYRDEARATQDVDVLVTKREVGKAIRALEAEFPYLEVVQNSAVARFVDPVTQKVVLDVMKPSSQAMQMVFRHTVAIKDTHRIPTLEMAMVSKFSAMTAPNRTRVKRMQDLTDFANMLQHNRVAIDLEKLQRLAQKTDAGNGKRIRQLVGNLDAGRPIDV